jgi:hypothetical protein
MSSVQQKQYDDHKAQMKHQSAMKERDNTFKLPYFNDPQENLIADYVDSLNP